MGILEGVDSSIKRQGPQMLNGLFILRWLSFPFSVFHNTLYLTTRAGYLWLCLPLAPQLLPCALYYDEIKNYDEYLISKGFQKFSKPLCTPLRNLYIL